MWRFVFPGGIHKILTTVRLSSSSKGNSVIVYALAMFSCKKAWCMNLKPSSSKPLKIPLNLREIVFLNSFHFHFWWQYTLELVMVHMPKSDTFRVPNNPLWRFLYNKLLLFLFKKNHAILFPGSIIKSWFCIFVTIPFNCVYTYKYLTYITAKKDLLLLIIFWISKSVNLVCI